ncbi:MAG: preprotein translocase subunit SecY [Clostridia bacterium]|nr:preprotein translocase subunit SecY [Clostridia bacterium]
MFKTLANAWKIADLKKKIIFTLLILLVYRVGACITVPFIGFANLEGAVVSSDMSLLLQYLTGQLTSAKDIGILSIMSGNAFAQATLFALGVSPYITSSIVMQLLAVAIPALERMSRTEDGKKKINSITRYVTIGIALITSIGYYVYLNSMGAVIEKGFFYAVVIIACYCAGSSLVMWLAEKINEYGIGNGISLILFANIVSRFPTVVIEIVNMIKSKPIGGTIYTVCACLFMLFLLWFIIFITDSERRIPVQYAKKVVGRKMYGGQNTNLPIKLNMTGVMPIIFASSIMNIPQIVNMFVQAKSESWFAKFVQYCSSITVPYIIVNFVLIVAFAYFYVAISFNPVEVSNNLQKNGGSIPGIRPGKPTSDFIKNVLSRITLIGALALSVVAVVPTLIQYIVNLFTTSFMIQDFVFAGSSVIIVVGVILETVKEIETQMSMRHYKGFLE